MIASFFTGIAQPAQCVMTSVAVDYGEWKFKANSGGFYGAINGFVQTLATAIAGGFSTLILALAHYVPAVPQTSTALFVIKFMMSIIPFIAFLLGFTIAKWDMTNEKH